MIKFVCCYSGSMEKTMKIGGFYIKFRQQLENMRS